MMNKKTDELELEEIDAPLELFLELAADSGLCSVFLSPPPDYSSSDIASTIACEQLVLIACSRSHETIARLPRN